MKSESEKEQSESESDKQDGESLKKPKAQNDANQAREEKMIEGRNSEAKAKAQSSSSAPTMDWEPDLEKPRAKTQGSTSSISLAQVVYMVAIYIVYILLGAVPSFL